MAADQTFYDIATKRLDDQFSRINALDTKAAAALGIAGTLLPIVGALFTGLKKDTPTASIILYALALFAFVLLVYFAARAILVRKWSERPDLATLGANSLTYGDVAIRIWVGQECVRSIAANEADLRRKSSYFAFSVAALALLTACLCAASLVSFA